MKAGELAHMSALEEGKVAEQNTQCPFCTLGKQNILKTQNKTYFF